MHGISSRNPHVLIQQEPFLTFVSSASMHAHHGHKHRLFPELHCEKHVSSINTRITCIPQLKNEDENINSLSKPGTQIYILNVSKTRQRGATLLTINHIQSHQQRMNVKAGLEPR